LAFSLLASFGDETLGLSPGSLAEDAPGRLSGPGMRLHLAMAKTDPGMRLHPAMAQLNNCAGGRARDYRSDQGPSSDPLEYNTKSHAKIIHANPC